MSSLNDSIQMTLFDHNWQVWPMKESDVDAIDYDRILQIYADRFADASDFTFQFVGNIDEAQVRDLACKYLATLPTVKRKDKAVDSGLRMHRGDLTNRYQKKMENPMTYLICTWNGPAKMSVENDVHMDILGQCLSTVYLKKIREDLGAAYSTQASANLSRNAADKPFYTIMAAMPLKPAMTDTTALIVQQVMEEVAAKGFSTEDIQKAKEYMLKTFTQNQRENGFWMGRIQTMDRRKYDPYKNYEAIVQGTTNADLQKLARQALKDGNRVRIIMTATEQ